MFTVFCSDVLGNPSNCFYKHKSVVLDEKILKKAVSNDYVCAEYKNGYRSGENFIGSDCLPVDCDNDHSDDPQDWVTPNDVETAFPGVTFAIHYSRSNNAVKKGKSARPRFHVLFSIDCIYDVNAYAKMKKTVNQIFPYFDKKALDSARFFYGTENAAVEIHQGIMTLSEFINERGFAASNDNKTEYSSVIYEGSRNATMSRFAGRVLKRYGITDRAYEIYLNKAKKCEPPLDDEELGTIWNSACKFAKKVQNQEGYIAPDDYEFGRQSLKPDDFSDIGQAKVMAREYGDELIYTSATDLLRYNGIYWEESKQKAISAAIEFLDLQLEDARDELNKAFESLMQTGISKEDIIDGGKKLQKKVDDMKLLEDYNNARAYKTFVMKRRDMKYIISALQTLKSIVNTDVSNLDSDPYLLNTPSNTYDLRIGMNGISEHKPEDNITKVTAFSPSDKGKELWLKALSEFFGKDKELKEYVQQMMGLSLLGKVFVEALIIAYGDGGNGKSTFGNAILRSIGSYGGTISADALTVGCKRNVKPELAEAKGKRLLIASELEEGMRLNTSMVKQLCSTDEISAEKKYKDPFHFTPSHTVLLYTNHLPRVGAMDDGIWRRLIIIPFNEKIKPKDDVKNYADYLVKNAGEYIIKWLIEGAEKIIKNNYKLDLPKAVQNAIAVYRSDNDWLTHFFDDCCELSPEYEEKSGEVYQSYRAYCMRTGEFIRSSSEFYSAIEKRGIKKKRTNKARMLVGLRLIEISL